ncbi:MAG: hypothetical protein IJ572_02010 [Bacilli bacterium]|nr:hypothetical protein [Bacilli bacterium]
MANKKSDNKNDIKDTNKKKNMIKKTDEKKQKIKTTENNEEKIDNKVVNKMNSSTKIKSKKPKKEEIEQNKVKEEKKDSKVVNKKSSSVKKKTNDTTIENKEITKVENKEEEFFDIVDDKKKKKNNNKIKKSEYYDILENDKSHLLLNIIILLLLIGAGIFLVYKYVIRDPKTIFTTGITRIYEEAANKIVKLSKSIITSDKQKLSGVLTLNTSDNNYNNLNNYVYDIDLNMDKTNHNYGLELNIKNQDTILSTLNYYFVNNMFYLNLGKNYNKSILLKQDIFDLNNDIFNINTINFNKLNNSAKQIKNIINSNINRKKLTMGEENLNDTTYEYVEYSLDNTSYSNLISKIIDDIKNNNNLINDLT